MNSLFVYRFVPFKMLGDEHLGGFGAGAWQGYHKAVFAPFVESPLPMTRQWLEKPKSGAPLIFYFFSMLVKN